MVLIVPFLLAALLPGAASGHAGLLAAEPGPGATLGASPTEVRITLSERPEPDLSEIRVLGSGGAAEQRGEVSASPDDPSTLTVPVRRLPRGVYTVTWSVVSTVDGHVTEGTYAFGVRISPGTDATEAITTPSSPRLELVARWVLLTGLALLLGASLAGATRPSAPWRGDLPLAFAGLGLATIGLLALTASLQQTAETDLGRLLDASIGTSLFWRAAALTVAALALLVAQAAGPRGRTALCLAGAMSLVAIVAGVAAGHAGAGSWPAPLAIATQSAHFAAAGVWFGGLAALLVGLGPASPGERVAATRFFAGLALVALLLLLLTGTLRAFDELGSWGELVETGYGRAILAKLVLFAAIVGLAARGRGRAVPVVGDDPGPLLRTAGPELVLAVGALGLAALLGTIAPPAPTGTAPVAISAAGADFATTTTVELTAASAEPGPNLFTVDAEDYDSGEPVEGDVELRFEALDDPGAQTSTLTLSRRPDGTYAGSGANLAFDGRWGINVLVRRGTETVEVPLEIELPGPEYFVSTLRVPGEAPQYTMQIGSLGHIRIEPDPERAGPSRLYVSFFTPFGSPSRIELAVLTLAAGDDPAKRQPLRRLGSGRFLAEVLLPAGETRIGVVATTRDGTRLRGVFGLQIPET